MTNIALLIPSTTKGKNWNNIEDSFFFTYLLNNKMRKNITFIII